MRRTRVKICGITRPEDAKTAAAAGVDALGLVFYKKSTRYVEIEAAKAIIDQLPPFVSVVGLFMDATGESIRETVERLPLDMLQFHGDECPADCGSYGLPYIKAVAMRNRINYAAYTASYPDAAGFLLDSHAAGGAGGTGETFDWARIPQVVEHPLILAGGITPDNVARAIEQVHPYGIDLSGGVESSPGIKDVKLIYALMKEVRKIDCS